MEHVREQKDVKICLEAKFTERVKHHRDDVHQVEDG